MPGVPQRDHPDACPPGADGEVASEVAGFDRGAVARGEDQIVPVLPQVAGSPLGVELLLTPELERGKAQVRQRKEVVRVLRLGLPVQIAWPAR
ncbi:hypothetical protein GCM10009757_24230 [Streptomyces cheonanensis]|uniref:Uncharacterized protein n=1 Tax=Streptomyces cheonanensis TaxID=312720 RepID=A0ABN2V7G0_9ACTN